MGEYDNSGMSDEAARQLVASGNASTMEEALEMLSDRANVQASHKKPKSKVVASIHLPGDIKTVDLDKIVLQGGKVRVTKQNVAVIPPQSHSK